MQHELYRIEQRYHKKTKDTRYHVEKGYCASVASFTSLVEAACVCRYLNQDAVTYSERKIAVEALKRAEGYNVKVYDDPADIDTTIPEPDEMKGNKENVRK